MHDGVERKNVKKGEGEVVEQIDEVVQRYYEIMTREITYLVGEVIFLEGSIEHRAIVPERLEIFRGRIMSLVDQLNELRVRGTERSVEYSLLRFASHELKNMFTIFNHYVGRSLAEGIDNPALVSEFGSLEDFCNRAKDALREFYKKVVDIRQRGRSFNGEAFTINSEVMSSLIPELVVKYISSCGYQIEIEAFKEESMNLAISRRDLLDILLEVVVNSVQAFDKDGKIEVSVREGEGFALFIIKDDGIGISDEVRESIFEEGVTTKSDGSGIGLCKVLYLVGKSGGDIKVDSVANRGTRVTIKIPLLEK